MRFRPRPVRTPVPPFGRGRVYALALPAPPVSRLSDDLKLFALTFAGGFLFMAIYLT